MFPKYSFSVAAVLFLLAINVVLLDLAVFSSQGRSESTKTIVLPTPTPSVQTSDAQCPPSCRSFISEEIRKSIPSSAPSTVSTTAETAKLQETAKEFYVPLGSGSTKSSDYEELPSAEAYVDTYNYSKINKVVFEVYLRNPTGNGKVYAKLFNATDKHDVWFSEVVFEGGGTARREAAITLEPGNKLYRVMLKSSLRYDAYVDTARIKIVTY